MKAGSDHGSQNVCSLLHARRDVLVHAQITRIPFRFYLNQPLIVVSVGGVDALLALVRKLIYVPPVEKLRMSRHAERAH
jgi:hypothetical protein